MVTKSATQAQLDQWTDNPIDPYSFYSQRTNKQLKEDWKQQGWKWPPPPQEREKMIQELVWNAEWRIEQGIDISHLFEEGKT